MEKRGGRTGAAVAAAFAAAIIIKYFFFDFVVASGRSMLPAIQPGAVLCVSRLAYGFRLPGAEGYLLRWASPQSGDVVVFRTPEGKLAVKRCREIRDGTFFAAGDNGAESFDSRSYGPVRAESIVGKVVGVGRRK